MTPNRHGKTIERCWVAWCQRTGPAWILAVCLGWPGTGPEIFAQTDFGGRPSWHIPSDAEIRDVLVRYLSAEQVDPAHRAQVLDAFSSASGDGGALDRFLNAAARIDARVADLVRTCERPSQVGALPDIAWLEDPAVTPAIRDNTRLYFGRWLVRETYFDEARDMLAGLALEDVVDPAALLFYRSIARHRLVETEAARADIQMLLERKDDLSIRYRQLAELMARDLVGIEPDGLDHIARRMDDIGRRLQLGRAGEKVLEIEQGVLDSLDKLIEEMEAAQQRQQQQQLGQSQGGQPMQDSRAARMQAPGKVDRTDIGGRAGWGDLPEKDREEAMQQIARDFPVHYRNVIEQYFRRLAAEDQERGP